MISTRPNQTRRRSLIAIARENRRGRWSVPLWKVLLAANGSLLVLVVLWSFFMKVEASITTVALSALLAIVYCTPITMIAHYGSGVVTRFSRSMSRSIRGALLVATWMVSGVIGSLLAYAAISLVAGNRPDYSAPLLQPMLIGNGVIAIGVGTFIVFFDLFNSRYRNRAELLSQQDLLTAELIAARNVQRSLMPAEDAKIMGFDINGTTEPAVEIGGDYYDYLSFADGTKGMLVADAAGKGVPAALVMAKFQGMTQALSIHVASPREFLTGLDDTLRIRLDRRSFITVGMLTVDLNDRCAFYRAGHNPLLLYRAASGAVETIRPPGLALGLTIGTGTHDIMQPATFTMDPGDVALLYSDGLNEATNPDGEQFTDQGACEALRRSAARGTSALEVRQDILAELAAFVGTAEAHDDITVVVVRRA